MRAAETLMLMGIVTVIGVGIIIISLQEKKPEKCLCIETIQAEEVE